MCASALTKYAQSVLSKESAFSLKCHFEKVAGNQKWKLKSLKNDANPLELQASRRWETTQLEGTIHRPIADIGAGFGLEFLQDEFSKACRTDWHPAAIIARPRSQAWSLFRRRSVSASERPTAVPRRRTGAITQADWSTWRGNEMMPAENKTPKAGYAKGADEATVETNLKGNDTTLASIRRRFGKGWPGYTAAKFAWSAANPGAEPRQFEAAMRRIVRAVKV